MYLVNSLPPGSSHRRRGSCILEGNGHSKWLPFFRLFPAVVALHLSGGVAAYIASALEDTADPEEMVGVPDVFPALHLIWLDERNDDDSEREDGHYDEPVGSIEGFLSLRLLSGRPVTVVDTQEKFDKAYRKFLKSGVPKVPSPSLHPVLFGRNSIRYAF